MEPSRNPNLPPRPVRRPVDRHYFNRIKQGSHARRVNSVIDPRVDVAADVAAINRGEAVRVGDAYTVNGRTYGLEASGTLFPKLGDGIHLLNRGAYQALGVYLTLGQTDGAEYVLRRMHNVGPAEREAALAVLGAVAGED